MIDRGTRLGSYEVLAAIGAGGMGEVYRARDTTLSRDVALKVLPPSFLADFERIARFKREAQLLASLNHPNIAAVYGFQESDGVQAIVLELVDGPTLADRLAAGALPVAEALPIASQIAEALEASHEQRIIHRDLKPSNVKVRPDGTVKVLDFGLAKDWSPGGTAASATITSPALTEIGVILGTAAYMSPEQAKGKPADTRSDIWALGCVLYEMLTGARAFVGDGVTDTLASVLAKEPDWSRLPPDTPASIRKLLRRCLEKDRRKRLDSAVAARLEIEDALSTPVPDSSTVEPSRSGARRATALTLFVAGALALAAIVASLSWSWSRSASTGMRVSLDAQLGADGFLSFDLGDAIALSRDGAMVAFAARKRAGGEAQLYVRKLRDLTATSLPGTDGAESPFFSPDGEWIGFFSNGKLRKISVAGGATVALCDAPNGRGAAWGDDDAIVFASYGVGESGLLRISAAGGSPAPFTGKPGQDATYHRWPQQLPGNRGVLFTASTKSGDYTDASIVVQATGGGGPKTVWRRGFHGRYLTSGHLAYVADGTLFIVAFDLNRLETTGQPVPLVQGIASNQTTGAAQFAASNNGTLAYVRTGAAGAGIPIVWMNREGKQTPAGTQVLNWFGIRVAPDGSRLAIEINNNISVYEWAQDRLTQVTFGPGAHLSPTWTPNGRRLAFASSPGETGVANLYWQMADGTGPADRLTDSPNRQVPGSWHPSGKFLAFTERVSPSSSDLMILPMEGDERSGWKGGTPTRFASGPSGEFQPAFSPDGRWIAYVSNESGRSEIFVQAFPGGGHRAQVSNGGGHFPTWSPVNRELFFSADAKIMIAPYTISGDTFVPGKPQGWSDVRFGERVSRMFDIHPDGKRFAIAPARNLEIDHITFVFNSSAELGRGASTTK